MTVTLEHAPATKEVEVTKRTVTLTMDSEIARVVAAAFNWSPFVDGFHDTLKDLLIEHSNVSEQIRTAISEAGVNYYDDNAFETLRKAMSRKMTYFSDLGIFNDD